MSALTPPRLRLKGQGFDHSICVGDHKTMGDAMDQYTTPTISPSEYRFPDVHYSSVSVSPPSSPSDSPSTSTSALPSANSSSLSLHPVFPPPPIRPLSPSLRDIHLPILSPLEILDTLDHLAANAPKKKSHARKQPAGHIPRPRNAFILFRCLFVSQQAVPASVEKDHRNISRIAGKVWKSMSEAERDPWLKAAELEKTRHEVKWPNYRYNPIQTQVPPRRFTLSAPKSLVAGGGRNASAAPDSGYERQRFVRFRPKREADDDDYFEPFFVPQHPISKLARVGSVPPPSLLPEDQERVVKCEQVTSLVRERKQGVELVAAIRPPPQQQQADSPFQFSSPVAPSPIRTPTFAMPTPMPMPAQFPRFMPNGDSPAYEMSLPPDSPPPTPTHIRLAARRSSSCPPLPPMGGAISFPFSNPFGNANPWGAPPYAYGAPPSYPSSPLLGSDASSPFAFPPPCSQEARPATSEDEEHEHRPLTAPEHHEMTPRIGRDMFSRDMSSRLSHRRGSSLDRAIASSSIAGAFGGGLPRPHMGGGHLHPDIAAGLASGFNHFANYIEAQRGHVAPGEYTVPSSRTGTPSLSPSPQSSFTSSFDSGFYDSSRAEVNFANDRQSRHEEQPREQQDHVMVYSPAESPSESEKPAQETNQEFLLAPSPPAFVPSGSMSPPSESGSPGGTKIPTRLFGSQGARLGLDLDLDVPLSLDVSFNSPPPSSAGSSSTPYSSQNPASAVSCDSESSPYPYTPSSPPTSTLVNSPESSLPPPYNYSYTQALMDTDPDVGADEFRQHACVPGADAQHTPERASTSP